MQDFKIKLNLIIDILREKNSKLNTLAVITENQGTILESREKSKESVAMLSELIDEKQKIIDEVLGYDDVFLKKYEEIKGEFDNEEVRRANREEILEMQELIISINDNNEKVITLEKANDEIVKKLRNNIEMNIGANNTPVNNGDITLNNATAGQAPMSKEFKHSEKTILGGNKHHSKVTNKPIKTIDIKAELDKSTYARESVLAGRQETGKKYKIKNVIDQYKNNKR